MRNSPGSYCLSQRCEHLSHPTWPSHRSTDHLSMTTNALVVNILYFVNGQAKHFFYFSVLSLSFWLNFLTILSFISASLILLQASPFLFISPPLPFTSNSSFSIPQSFVFCPLLSPLSLCPTLKHPLVRAKLS